MMTINPHVESKSAFKRIKILADRSVSVLDVMPSCNMMTISPYVEGKSGLKRIKILADRSVSVLEVKL